MTSLDFVFLGLSITSSWGNGHATTYRGLLRELAARGHRVTFLERDLDFYADNRDMPNPPYARTELYQTFDELRERFTRTVREADVVIVGSYVPDGVRVGDWVLSTARGVTGFYDIDTPVTLAKIARGDEEYLARRQIAGYDVYLSFTGGPTLAMLERVHGAKRARALYCSVDPELYTPLAAPRRWDLGYLGTYSEDRQPVLERLLQEPARALPNARFVVAGPQYPDSIAWAPNVDREVHLAPTEHRAFYCAQRYTLNVTRKDMVAAGFSPSVRLFEAAACGVPIVSDVWRGIETIFAPSEEIVLAERAEDVVALLRDPDDDRGRRMGERARRRVLREHTAAHRAETLDGIVRRVLEERARVATPAREAESAVFETQREL